MNDEANETEWDTHLNTAATDAEADLVNDLQDEVESQVTEMAAEAAAKAVTDPESRRAGLDPAIVAMALTVRDCQRRGHPDASKHIETLLTMLGV